MKVKETGDFAGLRQLYVAGGSGLAYAAVCNDYAFAHHQPGSGYFPQPPLDNSLAESAYRKAFAHGSPSAALNLGMLLYQQGQVDDALAAWRDGADLGQADCAECMLVHFENENDLLGVRTVQRDYYGYSGPLAARRYPLASRRVA